MIRDGAIDYDDLPVGIRFGVGATLPRKTGRT